MDRNRQNNNSGDTLAWIRQSMSSHAERQVATYKEVLDSNMQLEGAEFDQMLNTVRAFAHGGLKEWEESLVKEMAAELLMIERLAQRIKTPRSAALAIGRVSAELEVSVVKWRIIGDPRIIYCVKHCSQKSPTTRGHYYIAPDLGEKLGVHCQKCISELSNKKGIYQLSRLLERAGKLPRNHGDTAKKDSSKDRRGKTSPDFSNLAKQLLASEDAHSVEPSQSDDLGELSMMQLRQIAKSKGAGKMPRSKLEIIDLINSL